MTHFDRIIRSIKAHEEFRPTVYKDTLGIDTIGYGFAIKDLVLDEDVAECILLRKVMELERKVSERFDWLFDAPQVVRETIVEMCYQMGIDGFDKFKATQDALKRGDWNRAAEHILDSLMAKQTPARAEWYASQIRSAAG